MSLPTIWFSLYDNDEYHGTEPLFWNTDDIQGIHDLKKNTSVIYQELLSFLSHQEMESHFNITMVEKPKTWKVRSLRVWSVEMYQYQKFFPQTMKLLNNIHYVINAGFNLLEPHSKIQPHQGDTNAIIRCHLVLEVPEEKEKCFLVVGNQQKHWEAGEIIAFTDAYTHYAENQTNQRRIILLFDILRPEFLSKKNYIAATVLSSFYLQQIGNWFPSLYKLPRKKLKYFIFPLVKFIQVAIPIRNFIKKYL
ncbi:MAG: aspartyl/asparaginyl beta-hydroxylase domain-containing protein [Bacteroidia bacterium]|nr:aspartyl/asparaginyl beta-hydroxylase domain-containing protein [Bacteroidia bacterium]